MKVFLQIAFSSIGCLSELHTCRRGFRVKRLESLYGENNAQNLICIAKMAAMVWRNLSILGKIQIIKTFAIPKLLFRASVIPIPNDLVKEVNSILKSSAVRSSQILTKVDWRC